MEITTQPDVILKIKRQEGEYAAIGGMKASYVRFLNHAKDAKDTNVKDALLMRFGGALPRGMSLGGAAELTPQGKQLLIEAAFKEPQEWELTILGFGRVVGLFVIQDYLDKSSVSGGELLADVSLNSAGPLSFSI